MTKPILEKDLDILDQRLQQASSTLGKPSLQESKPDEKSKTVSLAFRVGIELISAITIGTTIGWYLDKWLSTSPWLMIFFILFGFGAGMLNIYKLAIKFEGLTKCQPHDDLSDKQQSKKL